MADGYVAVAPDSVGKKVDTAELSVNGQTVERQRVVVGDNQQNTFAEVTTGTPASTDPALVVKHAGNLGVNLHDELGVAYSQSHPLPVDVGASLNNVTVTFSSVVSTLNAPPATFTANQVWYGQWEEVKNYASITIAALSDQASAANGASAQFSDDGTNVLVEYPGSVYPGIPVFSEVPVTARYFRVMYHNGATAANVRAQIIYNFTALGQFKGPLASPHTDTSIGDVVVAAVKGRSTSGAWQPLYVDDAGKNYNRDEFTGGQALADQSPAGTAVTFTFSSPMNLIWVKPSGGTCRVDPFGGTPTSTSGIPCDDGIPNPITVNATSIKVYAGAGTAVSVWGFHY